jgi:hypothetical protein
MKLFIAYLLVCFFVAARRRDRELRASRALLIWLGVALCVGYFFLRQL